MANEKVFDQRAGAYDRGRPGYAPEAVQAILNLVKDGAKAVDIGAGTGIFTRELLRHDIETYAVEPNAQMRAKLEENLGTEHKLHIVAASAEATGLPTGAFDLITAASSFHWLDTRIFLQECRRLLKEDGVVCLLINARDYNDPFTQQQHALCQKYCPGFSSLKHGLEKTEAAVQQFFGNRLQRQDFAFPLCYEKEKFIERSLSSSYAPDPQDPRYGDYRNELSRLLDVWERGKHITIKNTSVLFWGKVGRM